jgi:(2R)-sulfolactate sulfo-lyase subunit alpha
MDTSAGWELWKFFKWGYFN